MKYVVGLLLGIALTLLVTHVVLPRLISRMVTGEFERFIDADPSLVFHAYNHDDLERFVRYSIPQYSPYLSEQVFACVATHIQTRFAERLKAAGKDITDERELAAYLIATGVFTNSTPEQLATALAQVDSCARFLPPLKVATEYHAHSGGIPGARLGAEWEPLGGVLIGWPCYLPANWHTAARLVTEVSEKATALVIVPNACWQKAVENFLRTHRYRLEGIRFIHIRNDDVWTRDYGPITVAVGTGAPVFVANPYVIPGQPHYKFDSEIALRLGGYFDVPVHKLPVVLEGGNIITDGRGTLMLSDSVLLNNPDVDRARLDKVLADYLGARRVILVPHLPGEVTGHIDGIVKVLDEDTLLITRLDKRHKWHAAVEEWVKLLASEKSVNGKPYKIHRIVTPQPPLDYQTWTYINSLTLNGKVIVPVYGVKEDEEALATYRQVMQGYQVVGIDYTRYTVGAVHCQTKEFPAALTARVLK
jgi:agmatine deiminase